MILPYILNQYSLPWLIIKFNSLSFYTNILIWVVLIVVFHHYKASYYIPINNHFYNKLFIKLAYLQSDFVKLPRIIFLILIEDSYGKLIFIYPWDNNHFNEKQILNEWLFIFQMNYIANQSE